MTGIRCYRLPLDENVVWGPGSSKHLCIMHMVAILNEVKVNGGDWRTALHKHIPKRKIKNLDVLYKEEELRRIQFLKRKLNAESYRTKLSLQTNTNN